MTRKRPARYRHTNTADGFASLGTLAVLLVASAVMTGAALYIASAAKPVFRYHARVSAESGLQDALCAVLALMHTDTTPHADSPFDPWVRNMEALAAEHECVIEVRPASDTINVNVATQEFLAFDYTTAALNTSAGTVQGIRQYRADNGISLDIVTHYKDFFPQEILTEKLSARGWININNADITVADTLLAAAAGTGCRDYLNTKRAAEETVTSTDQFMRDLGIENSSILTTASQHNVNFMEPDQLLALLRYIASFENPERSLTGPDSLHQLIMNSRNHGEILPDQLSSILSVPSQPHPVYSYLGTITWFWHIRIARKEGDMTLVLTAVACKIPAAENPMYGKDRSISFNSEFFQEVPLEANAPLHYDLPGGEENRLKLVSLRYGYEEE
ncbi:MAG: hypothetical protein JXB03_09855 [Spirochaetales bacterium]|nr:hypothetical protein [Spirochaetales bacterium]